MRIAWFILILAVVSGLHIKITWDENNSNNTNQLFEIVDIKGGNIIEITFQNVNTHEVYILNYLKKYCKNFESIKSGSKWSLPMLITPDETYLHAANLVCEY